MRVNMKIEPANIRANFWQRARDRYQIVVSVSFTEEEQFLIKKLGIQDHVLFLVPYLDDDNFGRYGSLDGQNICYTVAYFDRGQTHNIQFDRLIDAKAALHTFEQQFRALKETLDTADIPEHRILEL